MSPRFAYNTPPPDFSWGTLGIRFQAYDAERVTDTVQDFSLNSVNFCQSSPLPFPPGFSLPQPFYLRHILSSSFWIFVTNDQLFSLFSFLFLFINRISFRTVSEDSCVSPFFSSEILFSRRCLRMGHDFFRGDNFFCDNIR